MNCPRRRAIPAILKAFYRDRGEAAYELGRHMQAKGDFQKALGFRTRFEADGFLKARLGDIEKEYGNFQRAIELYKDSTRYSSHETTSGIAFGESAAYNKLTFLYASIGDIAAAREARQRGVDHCSSRGAAGYSVTNFYCQWLIMQMNSTVFAAAEGRYEDAGGRFQRIKELGMGPDQMLLKNKPIWVLTIDLQNARNLLSQQRLSGGFQTEARGS